MGRKPRADYDVLSFVAPGPPARPGHAVSYLEFAVNRRPLAQILGYALDGTAGVFGWQASRVEARYARQFLCRERSVLPSGRVPLYVCALCADLGCQSLAVRVTEFAECIVWSDFGYDASYQPAPPDDAPPAFPDVRDFWFRRTDYEQTVSRFAAGTRIRS